MRGLLGDRGGPVRHRRQRELTRWQQGDRRQPRAIEGVSLVNHFRKTFAGALANMTIDQLIERLKGQRPPR